jgi:predicted signal transduction protein with EAL and GGDEF domain
MYTVLILTLFAAMLMFQSARVMGENKGLGAVLSILCFICIVGLLWYRKKKQEIDPAIMSKDVEEID